MSKHPQWTSDDYEMLREGWGNMKGGIGNLAKKLGRSVQAVKIKACRLRLGPWLDAGEYVTFNQLIRTITGPYTSYNYTKWKKLGLRPMKRKCENCEWEMVKIEHFWKWAEAHQQQLDFSRFEEGALGIEPDWVKAKRKCDIINRQQQMPKKCRWSQWEDEVLRQMCERGTTWKELDATFMRSSGAIRRRIYDLGYKQPKRQSPTKWTNAETIVYLRLWSEGYSNDFIAKLLGKSSQSVRARLMNLKAMSEKGEK